MKKSRILNLARKKMEQSKGVIDNHYGIPPDDSQETSEEDGWDVFSDTERTLLIVPAEIEDKGDEIHQLLETLGLQVVDTYFLNPLRKVDPATYIGSGNAEALYMRVQGLQCKSVVFEGALSPSQMKNLEKIIKVPIYDRQGVILSIFQRHARTKLAKLQVEIAHLKYLQPRLSGLWMGLSRQRGGRGGLGGRGLGETRLELDRRTVKDRIQRMQKKLKEAQKDYETQSSRRRNLPRVALVGYTNAGKSTLMRRLTDAEVLVENKLFSTLDTTVRQLVPPTHPQILISDTVGFVRDLPHDLVASFKATLQESADSDLILHVVDVSHPYWFEHLVTTEETLDHIGAFEEKSRILLLNKVDRLTEGQRRATSIKILRRPGYEKFFWCSALTAVGLNEVNQYIRDHFHAELPAWYQNKKEEIKNEF